MKNLLKKLSFNYFGSMKLNDVCVCQEISIWDDGLILYK